MASNRKPEMESGATIVLGPKKRLHTGRSVWSDTDRRSFAAARLTKSLRCDVVIVGAGITGAFMADTLSRHYGNVVVLDRRAPATGSTHASTAMLQYEIDTPLSKLADQIGYAAAARSWQCSYRATQQLIRLISQEGIRCGLGRRHSLYLAAGEMGWRGMQREAHVRNRAGLECKYLSGKELSARFHIARTGAIYSSGAAIVDPVALTYGLLRKARVRGARMFAPAEVGRVMATTHGVILDAAPHFVEAKVAIFCTGYEVIPGLPYKNIKITSSWAAATATNAAYPTWLDSTLVWEAAKPYLYIRTDGRGRLIIGGEDADLDSPSYRADTLAFKGRRLAKKARRLLQDVEPKWKHVWAGAFGESADGLPIIGQIPNMRNCFTVMGFGGNGTIYAVIAASLMPGLLKGRPASDAQLFAFR